MRSKIDGPAAYDVLVNFEERWLKASKPHGLKKLKKIFDDNLLRIEKFRTLREFLILPILRVVQKVGMFRLPKGSKRCDEQGKEKVLTLCVTSQVRGWMFRN
ncbi:hypothetical protein GQ457_08G000720 [Hibiscus cannabinus]